MDKQRSMIPLVHIQKEVYTILFPNPLPRPETNLVLATHARYDKATLGDLVAVLIGMAVLLLSLWLCCGHPSTWKCLSHEKKNHSWV